jgi:hypothetical protein
MRKCMRLKRYNEGYPGQDEFIEGEVEIKCGQLGQNIGIVGVALYNWV